MDPTPAQRLLTKLRAFVETELDDDERLVMAHLLAPGIEDAMLEDVEVQGFGQVWMPGSLARALDDAVRRPGSGN